MWHWAASAAERSAPAADRAAPITGRRLSPMQPLCARRAFTAYLHTTLLHAELHFGAFDNSPSPGLWGQRPLLGATRAGAVRLRCDPGDLATLRDAYSGLILEPLVRAVRPHNGRRPFAPATGGTAVLVLPDYPNLFHQFGSLVIAWAAYQDSMRIAPPAALLPSTNNASAPVSKDMQIFMLNNATLAPTTLFWSPGLGSSPIFVRASPPPPSATYQRVILVQPATETWWWNVWAADHADRRDALFPLVHQLVHRLLPSQGIETASTQQAAQAQVVSSPTQVVLMLQRPNTTDRRILNEGQLVSALTPLAQSSSMAVHLVDLGTLSTRAQLALIRRTGLLIGAHGAGLLWNLFLPENAGVVELLNMANMNQYYANHCRWQRRRYAAWQNTVASNEWRALDPITHEPFNAFRNHMVVDIASVVGVVRTLLDS